MIKPEAQDYIDIHTHSKTRDKSNCFVLNNAFIQNHAKTKFERPVSLGLHPWHVEVVDIERCLRDLFVQSKQKTVMAIGECGLDRAVDIPLSLQQKVFEQQIELAKDACKPIIVHAVKTYADCMGVYKRLSPSIPFIYHAFQGNETTAQQLIRQHAYLSFGAKLLSSPRLQKTFKGIALKHLFLETDEADCPIEAIYNQAARLREMSIEQLRQQLYQNFLTCFF